MEIHFCRLYLLGKCYFCKIKFRFYCLWKLFLNDAFVSSWASFLRRRSGLALEIPIFDQALLVLFWNNWTLEMYLLLSLFRKTIYFIQSPNYYRRPTMPRHFQTLGICQWQNRQKKSLSSGANVLSPGCHITGKGNLGVGSRTRERVSSI